MWLIERWILTVLFPDSCSAACRERYGDGWTRKVLLLEEICAVLWEQRCLDSWQAAWNQLGTSLKEKVCFSFPLVSSMVWSYWCWDDRSVFCILGQVEFMCFTSSLTLCKLSCLRALTIIFLRNCINGKRVYAVFKVFKHMINLVLSILLLSMICWGFHVL